jgi:putative phage-type endonuclease
VSVVALDSRRQTLGGSTIAAACGVDPYTSPIRLWLAMTGRVPVEENEAMTWGRRLQPVILDGVREHGYDLFESGEEYRDPELPWLVGHPDALGLGRDDGTVFEAKASARGYDAVPVHYEAQVQTYMHLTGLDSAVLATLAGLHLTIHEIERRQHVIDAMLALAERFMEYVRTDTQPPPQGHADDRSALALAWPEQTPGKLIRETREIRDARRELVKVMEQGKAVKAREEALRATITDFMRDAETLISMHDEPVVTWKAQTSRRFNGDRFKHDHPVLYETYRESTPSRVMRLK